MILDYLGGASNGIYWHNNQIVKAWKIYGLSLFPIYAAQSGQIKKIKMRTELGLLGRE